MNFQTSATTKKAGGIFSTIPYLKAVVSTDKNALLIRKTLILKSLQARGDNLLLQQCNASSNVRGAVPGGAMAPAPPDFGRSVNLILTSGDRLCPPNYY
jgi:hypothetical protein